MKKGILLFLLLISIKVVAQRQKKELFNVGLKEGINTSQVSADSYGGFSKYGFVGGGFLKGNLAHKWTPGFEILYMQKGSRHYSDYENGDFKSYFLQLDYVEIPLMIQLNIESDVFYGLSVEAGPSFAFLVRTKEIIELGGVDLGPGDYFKKQDISINIGVTYRFSSHFGFNFRYTNSIVPIRKSYVPPTTGIDFGQLNSVMALTLTYDYTARKKNRF